MLKDSRHCLAKNTDSGPKAHPRPNNMLNVYAAYRAIKRLAVRAFEQARTARGLGLKRSTKTTV
jgi:hypothetical protein